MANLSNINNKFLVTTGGAVGVGVTNPGSKLSIGGTTGSYDSGIGFQPTGTGARIYRTFIATDGSFRFDDVTAGYLTRLTIDSAGNVGIGGSPSAWALGKTIQINGSYGTINYNGISAILGIINAYYNGSAYIRQNVGYAGSIDFNTAISGGGFAFRTENTTGSAGDTVTLSTKMAITSAGNVGIGTDSPSEKLHIKSTTSGSFIRFEDNGGSGVYVGSRSDDLEFYAGNSEKMVILSGGNVGIGSTNPAVKLEIRDSTHTTMKIRSGNDDNILFAQAIQSSDARIGTDSNTDLSFYSNASERMRIDSAGRVGIGTTSPSSDISGSVTMLEINDATNNNLASLALKAGTVGSKWEIGALVSNALGFFDDGTERVRIDSSGNIGVGVTPESWGTSGDTKVIRISTMSSVSEAFTGLQLASNFYFDGNNDKYILSDFASSLLQIDGEFRFRNASSGTAGNNISWNERMRIDSSGNIGINGESNFGSSNKAVQLINGVYSGAFQIDSIGNIGLAQNAYQDGTWKYYQTNEAAILNLEDGEFKFFNAASGTADTGISFTERMRISSTGNVGIGTTSPDNKLQVVAGNAQVQAWFGETSYTNAAVRIGGDNFPGGRIFLQYDGDNSYIDSYGGHGSTQRYRDLTIASRNIIFKTGNTSGSEKMRVAESGNVGIGITDPLSKLHISGQSGTTGLPSLLLYGESPATGQRYGFNVSADQLDISALGTNARIGFYTGGNASSITERMRITSAGDVGIGTADGPDDVNSKLHVYKNAGDNTIVELLRLDCGENNHNVGKGGSIIWRDINVYTNTASITAQRTGNTGSSTLQFSLRGSEAMRITSAGNVLIGTDSTTVGGVGGHKLVIDATSQNLGIKTASGSNQAVRFANGSTAVGSINLTTSSTTYSTSSDYRLKEDLQDFEGLDMVSKIPVYDFKWKTDESRSYGVMAHELQEVLPDAVVGEKDAEEMQGVDYSKIVPLLVKSIQELEAKIKILENK